MVHAYLARIAAFDRRGPRLNSVPVLNPEVFIEAKASDQRRKAGTLLSALDGIPFTAKDSFKAKGMTVAAGSPAFATLIANDDSYAVGTLRSAGAVLIGLTNMPPMAGGGMQRGLYGRAESPYNEYYLASAYGSGSSNGSGVATTCSFAAFGLGEETWSSGRAPASNNSLAAYTPSRGIISLRGNWPLFATMDVVVPHTRSMSDMLEVLDVLIADDEDTAGDFWREQDAVALPSVSEHRPESYLTLSLKKSLEGKRFGVPRMFINKDTEMREPIIVCSSVIDLWEQAADTLRLLGAKIVEVDLPAISHYEEDRPGAESMYTRGLVPQGFLHSEMWPLVAWSYNRFLELNGDPSIRSLDDVRGEDIFPLPVGSYPDRFDDDPDMAELAEYARGRTDSLESIPYLNEGLRGLENTRKIDFEDWLAKKSLDAIVFPANADVGPFDADFDAESNDLAWLNGVKYSHGNLMIRHLGIPTVSVPMGAMSDIGMPINLTFAGRAYDDVNLLSFAAEFDNRQQGRVAPVRVPSLAADGAQQKVRTMQSDVSSEEDTDHKLTWTETCSGDLNLKVARSAIQPDGLRSYEIEISSPNMVMLKSVSCTVDGHVVDGSLDHESWRGRVTLLAPDSYVFHSDWQAPYRPILSVAVQDEHGLHFGTWTVI